MLTEVKAYSSWPSAPTLLLDDTGRAETDLVQIRNIDGLNPVKATVNTSLFGSVDGSSYTGGSIASRNIVLTLHPNPDWDIWTYESIRKLLYQYFMPKKPTRLVFHSEDMNPVEIIGIVESVEANPFTKDQEFQVSVICPDPYFTAIDPTIVTFQAVRPGGSIYEIDYKGNIETGMHVNVTWGSDPAPTYIAIQIGDPAALGAITYFQTAATVSASKYFELNSVPMKKYVQNVDIGTGLITNLLSKTQISEGSSWPSFVPGLNYFSVITDQGNQDWELTYYERFGGL